MARTNKTQPRDPEAVVGYVRVSTVEQADSGLGLDAQRAAITAGCARRGWRLVEVFTDAGVSGKSLSGRPGMAAALSACDSGQASALMVSKLDRATRSVMDAAALLDRAAKRGWSLVALDLGIDTSTPTGELIASVMAACAQWERRAIGARTREALAAKRAAGDRLGRPAVLPSGVVARICDRHLAGVGWTAIATELNADGTPTACGGARWYPSTVRAVALRHPEQVAA